MSIKEKLKPLIFSLFLFLGVFVFNTNAFANFQVDYYGYDSDVLVLKISYPTQNGSYDKIIFPTADMGNFFYFWEYNYGLTDLDSAASDCGNYSSLFGSQYSSTYCISVGQSITFTFPSFYKYGQGMRYNSPNITKTWVDSNFGTDYLENVNQVPSSQANYIYYLNSSTNANALVNDSSMTSSFPFGSIVVEPVNGECGEAYGQVLTTIPPENSYACSSGTMIDFNGGLNELGTGIKYFWECEGSNGGYSVACSSAETLDVINGTCGSANNQTLSSAPYEYQKCSLGATNGSTSETLNGWSWSCYGFNGGSTSFCSAIYQEAETPPTIPDSSIIPTPTDCDSYSGIDKILCNLGNVIQGMFLPSSEKVIELQTTMNEVGNVFPFNYLRAISSVFNNLNFANGSLTMTMWGNTETLGEDFWDMELFDNIRLGATILILLMFTFWAIGYIKHFFK